MELTLRIWRQAGPEAEGRFETYPAPDVSPDMSFLEMLDVVNERLTEAGREPIAFDHDCREGICGSCGMMIDGRAHGPQSGTATTSCICANSETGTSWWWSRGGPLPCPSSGIWWWTAPPSIG